MSERWMFFQSRQVRPESDKISESGEIVSIITGLTTVTGLTFDMQGRMHALELSTAPGFPSPGNRQAGAR